MSHLDEGTLHALLDGELATSDKRQIEAHLGRCTACGTRLDEVRSVRAEADRLIGSLGSGESESTRSASVPPVSSPVMTQSGAAPVHTWSGPVLLIPDPPDSVVRRERQRRMATWAATVLVVVGAGYFAVRPQQGVEFAVEPTRAALTADTAVLAPEEAVERPAVTPETAMSNGETAQPPSRGEQPPREVAARDTAPRETAPRQTAPRQAPSRVEAADAARPRARAASGRPTAAGGVSEEATRELAKLRQTRADDELAIQSRRAADMERERREAEEQAAQARAAAPPPAPRPAAPPPATTLEERANVYLRIGLDEAKRQLGSPMHVIEGMTPALVGLTQGRSSPGMDTTRPVVRAVYLDPMNRLIILDQQRLRPGQSQGVATQLRSVIDDVVVQLHGEPGVNVLRNLASRIQ